MLIEQIRSLQLEITSNCNAHCPHCPRFTVNGDLIPGLTLDHWNIDAVLENLQLEKMHALAEVRIEGDKGDPAAHPRLAELLDAFLSHKNNPLVTVVTNGSIRTPKFWADLGAKSKNLTVIFSVDGLENTNHMYRVGVSWQRIMANVQAYIDAGGCAIWKCIAFQHNQHQLVEIKNLARQMQFARVDFMLPRLYEFDAKPSWPIHYQNQLLGELRPPTGVSAYDLFLLCEQFLPVSIPEPAPFFNRICPNLSVGHLYITYRHHVVPCCMMHNYLYENDHNPDSQRLVQDLVRDPDSIDLSKKTMSEILTSRFISHALAEHFQTRSYLDVCKNFCRTQIITNLQNQKRLNN